VLDAIGQILSACLPQALALELQNQFLTGKAQGLIP
jgi:hypothetical protein